VIRNRSSTRGSTVIVSLWLAAMLLAPPAPRAHEIPSDVMVRMFVKPDGDTLRVLVRVPLIAMRDIDFPVRSPDYLDISQSSTALYDAAELWIANYLELYEGGSELTARRITGVRVSLPSDPAFGSYESAVAHLGSTPLPDATDLPWQQAMLDAQLAYPIGAAESEFSIRPAMAHLGLRTVTVLRFLPAGGAERAFEYTGDPGLVRLDPRWHQAAFRFVALGFEHILDGFDHLLFLLCLVIPFRRFWSLVPIVTSFTVAHSLTLLASAFGLAPNALWFPPLIEMLIALSIVYMAIENVVGAKLHRRWIVAFGFGLVHGFGFSFALRETLQFAGSHLLTSLVSFNVGVELGQLFVLVITIPALEFLFRRVMSERLGAIVLSVILAHTGWHWMTERGARLLQYQFRWPAMDLMLAAAVMRWLMLALIVGGMLWVLRGAFGRLAALTKAASA